MYCPWHRANGLRPSRPGSRPLCAPSTLDARPFRHTAPGSSLGRLASPHSSVQGWSTWVPHGTGQKAGDRYRQALGKSCHRPR